VPALPEKEGKTKGFRDKDELGTSNIGKRGEKTRIWG